MAKLTQLLKISGLTAEEFATLDSIIIRPLKAAGATVWLFGSRATGKYKPFSDIDLLYEIKPGAIIDDGMLFDIKSQLEESDFPYKIDLVSRRHLAGSYAEQVDQQKIYLF